MANNLFTPIKSKLRDKKGGVGLIISFVVISLVMILFIVFSRGNRHFSWSIKLFSKGLKTSSKAALMQYKYDDENYKLISEGYVKNESEFNHFIELDHSLANETFYKMLHISTKRLYGVDYLKQYSKIAIIEPKRVKVSGEFVPNSWTYTLTMYKGINQIYKEQSITKANINTIFGKINANTTSLSLIHI